MKKIKNVIIFLIILLIIMLILVSVLINIEKNSANESAENLITQEDETISFEKTNDYDIYYTIKAILNNYIEYIKQINGDTYVDITKSGVSLEEAQEQSEEQGIEAISNILDEQYIQDLAIDNDMLIEKQIVYTQNGNLQQTVSYYLNIEEMQICNLSDSIKLILVTSKLNDNEFNLLIKMDYANNTYSIFLDDFLEKYNYSADMDYNDINITSENIEANSYNTYKDVDATEEYVLKQYFYEYSTNILQNPELAYEYLNEEYREAKFGSYEAFEEYINENYANIYTLTLSMYEVNTYEEQKEYICIDDNGKYYIFLETAVGEYSILLDTYTTDLPKFLEQYEDASEVEKVGYNIQRIFDAINDGDYSYVYSKLDSTFKASNFDTEESFEEYIKSNFYTSNKVTYNSCTESGNYYIYDLSITDETEENDISISVTAVMELGDDTDFVMSFSIN